MSQRDNDGLNARQRQMLDRIIREGEVKIADLRAAFEVTEMTIRRDLEKLEISSPVKRTFGGVIYIGKDVALQERSGQLLNEKILIGQLAASIIQPSESIFIDGGTTTLQIAKSLPRGMNITVVTNAMNVAYELASKEIPTLVTGGMLRDVTSTLVGPMAVQALSTMAFDHVFLGATGINAEHGFSNSNLYEAEIKRMVMTRTGDVNVVLDHSKFGAKVLISFAQLPSVHRVITDRRPEAELLRVIEEAGVEVRYGQ